MSASDQFMANVVHGVAGAGGLVAAVFVRSILASGATGSYSTAAVDDDAASPPPPPPLPGAEGPMLAPQLVAAASSAGLNGSMVLKRVVAVWGEWKKADLFAALGEAVDATGTSQLARFEDEHDMPPAVIASWLEANQKRLQNVQAEWLLGSLKKMRAARPPGPGGTAAVRPRTTSVLKGAVDNIRRVQTAASLFGAAVKRNVPPPPPTAHPAAGDTEDIADEAAAAPLKEPHAPSDNAPVSRSRASTGHESSPRSDPNAHVGKRSPHSNLVEAGTQTRPGPEDASAHAAPTHPSVGVATQAGPSYSSHATAGTQSEPPPDAAAVGPGPRSFHDEAIAASAWEVANRVEARALGAARSAAECLASIALRRYQGDLDYRVAAQAAEARVREKEAALARLRELEAEEAALTELIQRTDNARQFPQGWQHPTPTAHVPRANDTLVAASTVTPTLGSHARRQRSASWR